MEREGSALGALGRVEGGSVNSLLEGDELPSGESSSLPTTRVDRLLRERIRRNRSHQAFDILEEVPIEDPVLETVPEPAHQARLVVIANRLPVTCSKDASGKWHLQSSAGGLVSALKGVSSYVTLWIGWPGIWVKGRDRDELTALLKGEGYSPVWLDPTLLDLYYNGFCNSVLWQLFHYVPLNIDSWQKMAEHRAMQMQWQAYQVANEKFADVVLSEYCQQDVVWVQDYHLMLLPSLLKQAVPKMKVGFFLHTPFPSSEIYRTLPVREEVLRAVLAADLVGFHTYDYARHFISSCTRILGLEGTPEGVENNGVLTRVGTFPIGIDPERFTRALESEEVQSHTAKLLNRYAGRKIMLGVDRLDMVKGIPQKLLAYEKFLEEHPEWRDKVLLVQIAVPSRTDVPEYQKLRSMVHEIVGRINGQYGTLTYVPIYHLDTSLSFTELCALYAVTDVAMVTSLRDGMNLVSYEYVACQSDNAGVLVLSEFAGAAQSLGAGALLVNPWNISDMANAIYDALSMSEDERRERHRQNYMHVQTHTAQHWADTFITELNDTHIEADLRMRHTPPPLDVQETVRAYQVSKRRLIVLGYNATLTTSVEAPRLPKRQFEQVKALAKVNPRVMQSVTEMCQDPANVVVIFSGSETFKLDEIFGHLPVWLAAENGVYVRPPAKGGAGSGGAGGGAAQPRPSGGGGEGGAVGQRGAHASGGSPPGAGHGSHHHHQHGQGQQQQQQQQQQQEAADRNQARSQWKCVFDTVHCDWMESVQLVFDYFCERTPRSFVEARETSLVWNYKYADVEFGRIQARDLLQHLWTGPISNAPVEIIQGGKSVEVRPVGVTKGLAMQRLVGLIAVEGGLEAAAFDYVLCIGHLLGRDENLFSLFEGARIDGGAAPNHNSRTERFAAAQAAAMAANGMAGADGQAAAAPFGRRNVPSASGHVRSSSTGGLEVAEARVSGSGAAGHVVHGTTAGAVAREVVGGASPSSNARARSGISQALAASGEAQSPAASPFSYHSTTPMPRGGGSPQPALGPPTGISGAANPHPHAGGLQQHHHHAYGHHSAHVHGGSSNASSISSAHGQHLHGQHLQGHGGLTHSGLGQRLGQHGVQGTGHNLHGMWQGGQHQHAQHGGAGAGGGVGSQWQSGGQQQQQQLGAGGGGGGGGGSGLQGQGAGGGGGGGGGGGRSAHRLPHASYSMDRVEMGRMAAAAKTNASSGPSMADLIAGLFPPKYLYTCTVGRNRSKARYALATSAEVGDLLDAIVQQGIYHRPPAAVCATSAPPEFGLSGGSGGMSSRMESFSSTEGQGLSPEWAMGIGMGTGLGVGLPATVRVLRDRDRRALMSSAVSLPCEESTASLNNPTPYITGPQSPGPNADNYTPYVSNMMAAQRRTGGAGGIPMVGGPLGGGGVAAPYHVSKLGFTPPGAAGQYMAQAKMGVGVAGAQQQQQRQPQQQQQGVEKVASVPRLQALATQDSASFASGPPTFGDGVGQGPPGGRGSNAVEGKGSGGGQS